MKSFVIKGARVFTAERELKELDVKVENGKIAAVGKNLCADETVDAQGKILSPGFIDLHQHGMLRVDCVEDSDRPISTMSAALPKYGVTGFLPTVMTAPLELMGSITRRFANGIPQEGARALGLYMEGPHLNPIYKGAQEEEYMVPPSMENWETMNGGHPECIKVLAMDPTREGALEVARNLKGKVVLTCAHTPANWQQARDAFEAGFTHVTHLFNAMKPLHHRDPGLLGAALVDESVTCELIADLIHLHPDILRLAVKMKGADRICLITDAMMAAGLEDGDFTLGGQDVFVRGGAARLADGTLAGSTLTLNKAVYNMVKKVGLPLTTILPMVTSTPAREAGCGDVRGTIAPGYEADLVLLDDELSVCSTWVGGELKYQK